MCHHGAEEWDEIAQRLLEEQPEDEFETVAETEERLEEEEEPATAPADD